MWWSIPYGDTKEPFFWGTRTAAVNFCEEDYIITHYVAEFFNTLTSLAYIAYGIHGIRRYKRQDLSIFAGANLSYWALIGVGIFSGLYHLTLKYHTQMSDELSMHLAIGTVLQQVFTFKEPPKVQVRNTAIILGVLVPFVIYHCVADEFMLHVILFFCMSLIVARRVKKLIREQINDADHRAKLRSLVTLATFMAMFAYFLWNIDVHCCGTLTRWKRQLGMPLGILLEFHGYWHILTSISAYTFMAIIEFLISEGDANRANGFAWPAKDVLKMLPTKNADETPMNGGAKGGN
ncbi:related to YPC1-Alkaline Ceramidase [Ramularia collo-cygni]|uniref:Related to YPC1-Alkaline Ceramidase n=1 Tax=Ramularia collo-cygni TaxID=112498 RepID=A0A2D3V1Q7_9PEZI|nr:related to YPC1-Alkaline Ceramidase [Ramularia collo-cygni]CZT24257.1 related to YPC1-Alkaline Ceramidase [Ramularia collo-cygni]